MCESNAYLTKAGKEELLMKNVIDIRFEKDEILLRAPMGEEKRVKARLKQADLLNHKIIFESSNS